MERLKNILKEEIVKISLIDPKKAVEIKKINIIPIKLKGVVAYQATQYIGKQVTHVNLDSSELNKYVLEKFIDYKQALIDTTICSYHITNLNKIKIRKSDTENKVEVKNHNNDKKHYINASDRPEYLYLLDVCDKDYNVKHKMQSKYKQINKYVELLDDVLSSIDTENEFKILDFGCGKGYLTFSLYYYLTVKKGLKNIRVVGVDLKKDVVNKCNEFASKLGYDGLEFVNDDVANYDTSGFDMLIALHLCNNGTDEAIVKALEGSVRYLYLAPCCHQEVVKQIKNKELDFMLKYGIIKENFSTLLTDSLRALMLEAFGYKTNIIEFISSEHTPKNMMIKCNLTSSFDRNKYSEYIELEDKYSLDMYLRNRVESKISM